MDAVNFEIQGLDSSGMGEVLMLTAVKISKMRFVFNAISRSGGSIGS